MRVGKASQPTTSKVSRPESSVLVYVIAMLEVPVTVMEVIDMVVMRDLLAVVVVGVRCLVAAVDLGLRVTLAVVDVIDVIAVYDGFMAVIREVFVIAGFGVLLRFHGFLRYRTSVRN